ncbi:MAG: GNAT family N-acetyltransferase [Luteolibacter sp.]
MNQGDYQIHELHGSQTGPWLDALGGLRIRVFREYPYLYDGSLEYERDYLKIYQESAGSLVVIVTGPRGEAVAATTCLPMIEEAPEFQAPFIAQGFDLGEIMYFGESIALTEWRGRGLGKEFFLRREAHARRMGLKFTTFCAVDRAADHPLRPADYRPLDDFWKSRGYVKQPSLQTSFTWKEIGEERESPKTMTFWMKSLA